MKTLFKTLDGILLFMIANSVWFFSRPNMFWFILPCILLFLLINIFPSPANFRIRPLRLCICADGASLLVSFLIACTMSIIYHIWASLSLLPDDWLIFTISIITAVCVLSLVFWNGILRVYCTSVQLGIKHRIIGLLCGWIPIANIFALFSIISITTKEVEFELKKQQINKNRADKQVCKTKYPLLLVHGVFFRDTKMLNYWGRIPEELENNGAKVFYGNHQSALSVEESGREIADRIKEIISQTGCEKVNIIAHSKGGLDCRYAISHCGVDSMVASLTTISTPHKGCLFADYLLFKVGDNIQSKIAAAYNKMFKKFGDETPDFLSSVNSLTYESCSKFNRCTPNSDKVYYQSVGSKLNKAVYGKFPMNFSYHLVKHFDGANDGLVSEKSFPWGERFTFVEVSGKRGVSHADMIDLNRENIPQFDVREFYVKLVSDLKRMGY